MNDIPCQHPRWKSRRAARPIVAIFLICLVLMAMHADSLEQWLLHAEAMRNWLLSHGAIEAATTKWLLPAGQSARFDWSARQRHDQQTRANVMRTEIEAGLLDVDEGRRQLNRPPLATITPEPVEVQES